MISIAMGSVTDLTPTIKGMAKCGDLGSIDGALRILERKADILGYGSVQAGVRGR